MRVPLKHSLLVGYALAIILPFLIVFFATFKSMDHLFLNPIGWPESFALTNYIDLFRQESMLLYFKNSVVVTGFSVFFTLFFASLAAYAIMRMKGWKAGVLFGFFSLGMMIPSQTIMIPLYLLLNRIGLTDTLTGITLAETTFVIPVGVFILTGFMKALPHEMIESSQMDGANEWRIYRGIVLPLTMPAVSTVAIFALVIVWNSLLFPMMLLRSNEVKTLPLKLLEFKGQYLTNYPELFAGVIVISIPMVLAYLFLQKYFIEGMTAGSVKM